MKCKCPECGHEFDPDKPSTMFFREIDFHEDVERCLVIRAPSRKAAQLFLDRNCRRGIPGDYYEETIKGVQWTDLWEYEAKERKVHVDSLSEVKAHLVFDSKGNVVKAHKRGPELPNFLAEDPVFKKPDKRKRKLKTFTVQETSWSNYRIVVAAPTESILYDAWDGDWHKHAEGGHDGDCHMHSVIREIHHSHKAAVVLDEEGRPVK